MEFSPFNAIVKQCMLGMRQEEQGLQPEAQQTFLTAWKQASEDLERFIVAYHIARLGRENAVKIHWLETMMTLAEKINDHAVSAALPVLHESLASAYENEGNKEAAAAHLAAAVASAKTPTDPGPFYHGTRADLKTGQSLTAGFNSNYQQELIMNHVYFTALFTGAALAAALAKREGPERIYLVEPTGNFEDDPNVTNKKFPGNLTRSYRSGSPIIITGEVTGRMSALPAAFEQWRESISGNRGPIIN